MLGRWLRYLTAVPKLIAAIALLKADVEQALRDVETQAALKRFKSDPAVAPLVPRISAEWRAVEDAVKRLK